MTTVSRSVRALVASALKELTPWEINTVLQSDRLKVPPEELELLHRELGGTGGFSAIR
jgi:hypothetical protein